VPPPVPPPAPPPPATPCPEISFTERTLRKGEVNNEWCHNFGVPNTVNFDAANEAACLSHYIDPVTMPADPGSYPFDCSYGCHPCVYSKNPTVIVPNDLWKCRNSPDVIIPPPGCPSPPVST